MAPQNSTLIHENGNCKAAFELSQCFQPLSPLDDGKMENSSKCSNSSGGGATTSTPTPTVTTTATTSNIRGSKKWNKKSIYCRAINYKTQGEV